MTAIVEVQEGEKTVGVIKQIQMIKELSLEEHLLSREVEKIMSLLEVQSKVQIL